MKTSPRIYVGTYAKYNNASIEGKWLTLEDYSDKEEFYEACRELHKDEADPEFMFQDFEGFPREFYSESSVPDALFDWLALSEDDRELLERYVDATGNDADIDAARDAFHGTADSEAAFAEQTAEDVGDIPKDLPSWIIIDWQASWDCNLCHDYNTSRDDDGTIWFFLNH